MFPFLKNTHVLQAGATKELIARSGCGLFEQREGKIPSNEGIDWDNTW